MADPDCTEERHTGQQRRREERWKGPAGGTPRRTNPYLGTAGARPRFVPVSAGQPDKFDTYPGCNYYGDTRIRFNSNGTMTVWNTGSAASR